MIALALVLLVAAQDPVAVEPVPVVDPAADPAAPTDPAADPPAVVVEPTVDPAHVDPANVDPAGPAAPIDPAGAAAPSPPAPPSTPEEPPDDELVVDAHPDALFSAAVIAASIAGGAVVGLATTLALLRVRTFGLDQVGWVTLLTVTPAAILLAGGAAFALVPDRVPGLALAGIGLAAGIPAAAVGFVIGDLIGTPLALIVLALTGATNQPLFIATLVGVPTLGAVAGGVAGGIGAVIAAQKVWAMMEEAQARPIEE